MIVTVWDWDDTLMATSFLFRLGVNTVRFPELSKSIKRCLELSLKAGHVYIITNGEGDWVRQCITENLVDCDNILERVHLLSTVDTGLSNITSVKQRKLNAFDRISGMFNKRKVMHHLICFGDCMYDRKASDHIREKIGSFTYVKNIKFTNKPSLSDLLREQEVIQNIYPSLLIIDKHLDWSLFPTSFLPSNLTT